MKLRLVRYGFLGHNAKLGCNKCLKKIKIVWEGWSSPPKCSSLNFLPLSKILIKIFIH